METKKNGTCAHTWYQVIFGLFFPSHEHSHEHSHVEATENIHADNTDNATTTPSSITSSRQHHARAAYPYVVYCCCGYVLQQYMQSTYSSKPTRWFVLNFR